MTTPKKDRDSAADFPPEADTFEKRLLLTAQYASMAHGQLFSSVWQEKDRKEFLHKAQTEFAHVSALCEALRMRG